MKRVSEKSFALICILILCLLTGCSSLPGAPDNMTNDTSAAQPGERLSVVTTIFPEYDWVRNIMGECLDDADVTLLMDKGVDMHSFQPTVDDIMKVASCDMFIYVGGESDSWVDGALEEAVNPDMCVVNLMDVLGDRVKEEEIVEGMESEDGEDADEAGESGEAEEVENDEHVWLSLKNAAVICDELKDRLAEADPSNADIYRKNAEAYIEKLGELDAKYEACVSSSAQKTLLFGDRFPFRYLTDDYGLSYYAAFAGCSAETEANFETVIFLAGKADELDLGSILVIDGSDGRLAETIRDNTSKHDQQILTIDSMQSISSGDIADGITYLSVMESDLDVLGEALK